MRKPGSIEPIVFFKDAKGKLMLAAYSAQPTPEGYSREYADTLPAARELEKRLQQQDRDEMEREGIRDLLATSARRKAVRDRMYASINSSATSEYDKEFLRLYIQLDDSKTALFEQRWLERTSYLHSLHYDSPKDRAADEERVDLDRINL